jgi:uncharacterized membrane protein
MEDFRKKMYIRQVLLICGLFGACCLVMLTRQYEKVLSVSEFLQGFVEGFQVGIIVALFGFMIFCFIRNVAAMKNPDRMKRLYISETDERKLMIIQKSGSDGMNIVMYGLAVGTAVAGNLNDTVFFTLLGACLFVILIRGFMKLYYYKKH